MVDAYGARWTYPIDAPLSRKFGGRPPCFKDLENSAYGLVTISKLLFYFTCFYSDDFFWHVAVSIFIMLNVMLLDK